ncbi:MAG: hypothetical protein QOJ03_1249, partial [Frankiaceae bacterium]|nr:hypothetical protein [Frankiaceae bacterium]
MHSLGFRTDLMLRRLAGATVEDRGDHLLVRTPANPTFYWGNFLLFANPPAPGDGTRWLQLFADELPDASHVAIGVDGTAGDLGAAQELVEAGLAAEVNTVLTADRLGQPFRDVGDAVLRPLHSDDDWRQALELRSLVYGGDTPAYRVFVSRQLEEARVLADTGCAVYVGAFVDGVL